MKTLTKTWVIILVTTSMCSWAFASTFSTNFSLGSKNNEIKIIQQFLISQGFLSGFPTNYFGLQTKKAVQAFQKKNGLPTTGVWSTLTRQKAESLLLKNKQIVSTSSLILSSSSQATSTFQTINDTTISDKKVTLKIITVGHGYVLSAENNITCYDDTECNMTIPVNKKITLNATPKEGYSLSSWSEANCGTSLECPIKIIDNTTVFARFEIKKQFKPTGMIMSPAHSGETCYIPLGAESCDMRLTWVNNSALDMTIKVDADEYYLALKDDRSGTFKTSDLDPEDIAKTVADNVSGPVYFSLFQGIHKVVLKSRGQILDTANVDVKCASNHYWDGTKCWEKGANRLYVFKTNGVVITSLPTGIKCGYNPERCTAGFSSSTVVTLKATVTPGYVFDGWYGDCSGKELTCNVLVNKEKSVGVKIK